uniref:26S proteasome regulatory subunit Rpn7 N-terminal domain-containing protein n=1 Tax=Panagrolaimus superbus TaxID=310955 RepID=A0A914Z1A3_9BILA
MRNFVQNYYNFIKTEAATISTINNSNVLSKISAVNISEFECDIVFYVECLNPSKSKTSNITAVKDMAKTAADKFISVDHEVFEFPDLLSTCDIAYYGCFCALASYDRNQLKEKVINNGNFRKFMEPEG